MPICLHCMIEVDKMTYFINGRMCNSCSKKYFKKIRKETDGRFLKNKAKFQEINIK